MMQKALFPILISLFFTQTIYSKEYSLSELRSKYMVALHSTEHVEEVYETFEQVKEPSGKVLAYRGALEAIMTKTTWNLFKKISYLKKSEQSFKKAVSKSPNDVEIRFMRLAVQFEIPEYLGFSSDIKADIKFISENIENFDTSGLPEQTIKEIYGFIVRCNYFTDAQEKKFKHILELN